MGWPPALQISNPLTHGSCQAFNARNMTTSLELGSFLGRLRIDSVARHKPLAWGQGSGSFAKYRPRPPELQSSASSSAVDDSGVAWLGDIVGVVGAGA